MKELLTNGILKALPGEAFARLLPHLEPVSLVCGEDLYKTGDEVHAAYFPENAVVSHLHVFQDGSLTEAAMIGHDGMVGLSAIFIPRPPAYWTRVAVAGSALRVPVGVIRREFARGGEAQRVFLHYAGCRMEQLSQRAVCSTRHTVEERVCNWLLMIRDRVREDQLPLTHEQIACHLGTRRAGVTRVAKELRDRGIIEYSRGLIRITDRHALEGAACECYRILRRASLNVH